MDFSRGVLESTPESEFVDSAPTTPTCFPRQLELPPVVSIFVIGITGYIGGSVTRRIVDSHPEFNVSALVRNEDHIPSILASMPRVRIVLGTLEDRDLLINECSNAKIVIQMAMDHEEGLSAIIEGLKSNARKDYGYFIHTSSTAVLIDQNLQLGEYDGRRYDDVSDFDKLAEEFSKSPYTHYRSKIDTMVMNAAKDIGEDARPLRIAIICPSSVYGFGCGPVNRRGHQVTELIRSILLHKSAFTVGNGKNCWNYVDIDNLADAYLFLVKKALTSSSVNDGDWDPNGYYVIETGELCWGTIAKEIGELVHERLFIDEPVIVEKLSAEEVDGIYPGGSVSWGTNSRCFGSRLRQLGWEPRLDSLDFYIEERMSMEIEALYGITLEEQELETESRGVVFDSIEDDESPPKTTSSLSPGEMIEIRERLLGFPSTEVSMDIDAEVASGASVHSETLGPITTNETSIEREIKKKSFMTN